MSRTYRDDYHKKYWTKDNKEDRKKLRKALRLENKKRIKKGKEILSTNISNQGWETY